MSKGHYEVAILFASQEFPALAYDTSRLTGRKYDGSEAGGEVHNKGRCRCAAIEKFKPAKFLQLKSLMPGQKCP